MDETDTTKMLLAAIGALASVIVFLFRNDQKHYSELKQRSDECEDDRKRLWRELASIRGIVAGNNGEDGGDD